jgi:hypothetical protein
VSHVVAGQVLRYCTPSWFFVPRPRNPLQQRRSASSLARFVPGRLQRCP